MGLESSLLWRLDQTALALDSVLLRSSIALPAGVSFAGFTKDGRDLNWLKRLPQGFACDARLSIIGRSVLLERLATQLGPCLVCDPPSDTTLAVVFDARNKARLVLPDGTERQVTRGEVLDLVLSTRSNAGLREAFGGMKDLDVVLGVLSDAEFDTSMSGLVTLGPDAAHPLADQLRYEGAFRSLGLHVSLVALQWLVSIGAWWTLGSSIADGHVDGGRIAGWAALTLTATPLQYLASRALRGFSVPLGARLKRRMLEGAFRLDARDIRKNGYGLLLGRVNESSIVERIDLIDVFGASTSLAQVAVGVLFLWRSTLFRPLFGLLAIAALSLLLVARSLLRSFTESYTRRLKLTDDLVEKLLGHRTRAIQQPSQQYHTMEDAELVEYGQSVRRTDNLQALALLLPRMWLIAACAITFAAFLLNEPSGSLALGAIGALLVYQALGSLTSSLQSFLAWRTAFEGVRSLIEAGRARDRGPRRSDVEVGEQSVPVVVSATSLSFAYRPGGLPILNDASFRVHRGEKVLVTGPSGGGKTTLFKLIGGELRAAGGTVLVTGVDANLVSDEEWRAHVASAPQFHENYLFGQPVAFNLDPRGAFADPSTEARSICEELGLDRVIERMPQGYAQLLGETGWQLSHGERSRIYIARALLQGADLFLFDESFGALDPETQLMALQCARRRAKTLMVIAHV